MSLEEDYFFEDIDPNNLKLNRTKLFIIFSLLVLIMSISLTLVNFLIFKNEIYHYLSIIFISMIIISVFWIINSLVSNFLRENVLKYVKNLKEKNGKVPLISNEKKSLCLGCGKELQSKMFESEKYNIIKPYTLFRTTGYYCRDCFRRYFLICSSILFFEFLIFYVIFLPMIIIFIDVITWLALLFLTLIIVLNPIVFIFVFFFNLRQYIKNF